MCSPEVQTAFAVQRSMLRRSTVYEEPAVAEASRVHPRLLPVFQNAVARPSSAAADLYRESRPSDTTS
jgi:hypothetical protein